jgi:hypothetical protein
LRTFAGWRAPAYLASVVLVAGVVGCSHGSANRVAYTGTPCPQPNFPGMPQADLGSNYSCGYLSVPENRDDPESRTIRILVARVKAASNTPKADPIVFLAGGPGGAGTLNAPAVVAAGMNSDRDVIFVNQRGTVHSDPHLSCPEMDDFSTRATQLVFQAPATADLDAAAVTAGCPPPGPISRPTTPGRTPPTSPIFGNNCASTSGMCTACPTAPIWLSNSCATIRRASGHWSWIPWCRRR